MEHASMPAGLGDCYGLFSHLDTLGRGNVPANAVQQDTLRIDSMLC